MICQAQVEDSPVTPLIIPRMKHARLWKLILGWLLERRKLKRLKREKFEEKDGEIEKEESGNQGDEEERGVTLDYFIDKNSPWKRTKDQIMNEPNPTLPDYIKPPYPIIKKKLVQEDEAWMFEKFKDMLKQLQVSLSLHEILELIPKFAKFM